MARITDEVREVVERWATFAREAGVGRRMINSLQGRIPFQRGDAPPTVVNEAQA